MITDNTPRNRIIWEEYKDYVEEHGEPRWSEIRERVGERWPGRLISERQIRRIVGEIRNGKRPVPGESEPEEEEEPEGEEEDVWGDWGEDPDEGTRQGVKTKTSQVKYGNYLRFISEGTWEAGYPSVDDFLASMGVDTERWEIRRGQPNSWPTSGWDKKQERPWTVINHQVKAELLLRQPQPIEPQVQPVTITSRQRARVSSRDHHRLKAALFISDPHFGFSRDLRTGDLEPFHDRRVLDIAVQLIERLRPDEIILGGDTLDLPDWSTKFVRSPNFYFTTQPAIVEAAWWLAQFRSACPPARIRMLEGNHDARLETALATHLNQVYQLKPADEMDLPPSMSVPRLLALHKLDIEYLEPYPDAEVWLNNVIAITHGDKARSTPGATVGAFVRERDATLIHGHIHRHEVASRNIRVRNGTRTIRAICPGCTCHTDGRVPGSKRTWQQGMALVRYDDADRYTVTTITVEDGEALFEGRLYRGEERMEDIVEQTEWEF